MEKVEKAHKMVQNILLNGEITLNGRALTMTQLSQLVSSEVLLYKHAAAVAQSQEPPSIDPGKVVQFDQETETADE